MTPRASQESTLNLVLFEEHRKLEKLRPPELTLSCISPYHRGQLSVSLPDYKDLEDGPTVGWTHLWTLP